MCEKTVLSPHISLRQTFSNSIHNNEGYDKIAVVQILAVFETL